MRKHTQHVPEVWHTKPSPRRPLLSFLGKVPDRIDASSEFVARDALNRLCSALEPGYSAESDFEQRDADHSFGVPCSTHNHVGFDLAPVLESDARLGESFYRAVVLDLDSAVDDLLTCTDV